MAETAQEQPESKAKTNIHPAEEAVLNLANQIKLLAQENEKLKTENAAQKKQVDKKDSLISQLIFSEIDKKLKEKVQIGVSVTEGQGVSVQIGVWVSKLSDYMNEISEKWSATELEKCLNRVDEKEATSVSHCFLSGDTFLHRVIRLCRLSGFKSEGDFDDYYNDYLRLDQPSDVYRENYHKLMSVLLEHGAKPDVKTKDGKTCLHLATENGYRWSDSYHFQDPVIIELLLKYGADTELKDDKRGDTALHIALRSISYRKLDDSKAVKRPSYCSSENAINLLIGRGADCNARTKEGHTPIQLATIVQYAESPHSNWLSQELKENATNEWKAECETRCKIIIALWEGGADPNALYKNGDTLLHRLCSQPLKRWLEGYAKSVSLSFIFGLNKQMTNSSEQPQQFETKIVSLFKNKLNFQFDMLNAKNSSGDTPIFSALNFMKRNMDGYRRFNSRKNDEFKLFGMEAENEILNIVRFLGENGANLNVVNKYDYSPLLLAVLRGFSTVADYLVAKGAVLFPKQCSTLKLHAASMFPLKMTRFAGILAGMICCEESCRYLRSLRNSNRGRFARLDNEQNKPESWFDHPVYAPKDIESFGDILKRLETPLKIPRVFPKPSQFNTELIKQAARSHLAMSKVIEEDHCVICYENKPSVTFFPCGHKIYCTACHEQGKEQYSEKGCGCCRGRIRIYKFDDKKPNKSVDAFNKKERLSEIPL